jgi:hypothetical protein
VIVLHVSGEAETARAFPDIHPTILISIYPRAFLVEVFKVRFRVHLFACDFLDESWWIVEVAWLVYIFYKPFLYVLEVTSGDLFLPVGN